jgi:hypothetical protein
MRVPASSAASSCVSSPLSSNSNNVEVLASFKTVSEGYTSTTERRFCSACGSAIFSTIESMPGLAFLKAGTIEDTSWIEPTVEIWTGSAQQWAPHFENAVRFESIPG